MSHIFSFRGQIIDVVHRLFYYTDTLNWNLLIDKVFAPKVKFDMSSMGNPQVEVLPAQAICKMWDDDLKDLDAVHHQSGNHIIDIKDNTADVVVYARATHYSKGKDLKEFVGSYNLHVTRLQQGWRIDAFKFNLKYTTP